MATSQYCCFKGRGEISLMPRSLALLNAAGFAPVGNASQFDVNVTEKTDKITDYTSPAGGVECVSREIEQVDLALTLVCHSIANLNRALYASGAQDNVAGAAVAGESVVLWPLTVAPLANLVDDSVAVVVKSVDNVTTYTAGVDYVLTGSGSIKALPGSTIPAPTLTLGVGQPNVKVSYTAKTHTLLQMFARVSEAQTLHFDGFNIAGDTTVPYQFGLYNIKLQAADKFEQIGDGLSKLTFKGWALRDPTKPPGTLANPLSQYGTLKI